MSYFITRFRLLLAFFVLFSYVVIAEETIAQKEFDCVIIPSKVADLGSNDAGVISKMPVDRNDLVKQGDVISVLDDTVEQATVELASKQATLTSEVESCKIKLAYAQREGKRAQKAYKKKALSLHDFDKIKVEVELEKMRLLQAKEKLAIASHELIRAKARLEHRTIRAPFSGVITERFKVRGEHIRDEAVVRLAQLDPLHVEVIVPASYQGEITEGMQAKVCSDMADGKGWDATVSQVDKVMDARSGTYGVRLTLPNPEYEITAGVRCDLKFITPESPTKENTQVNNSEGATSRHG